MEQIKKYSYVVLWAALIIVVGLVWLLGRTDGDEYINEKSPLQSSQANESSNAIVESSNSPSPSVNSSMSGSDAVQEEAEKEMVGLWIPFMSLTTEEKTRSAFEEKFKEIVATSKAKGINALFVHVRPFSDALYSSEYYPWSHILTGEQGRDPGFDPLEFMIDQSHENGMEIHAWINPLRVKSGETPGSLSSDNPYSQLNGEYPFYFMEYEGGIYLNPAYQYVRTLICNGVAEIVKNYDVDGIHFDDYFYPSEESGLDAISYEGYLNEVTEPLSLNDWRKANINSLISQVYNTVKQERTDCQFGISPAGNIENNGKIGADVAQWCAVQGYIDYICPQLYYSHSNAALGYSQALSSWMSLERHEDLKMYIGLALYKAGTDADAGTWLEDSTNIKRQIKELRGAAADGFVLYSYDYLDKQETFLELENAMGEILRKQP